MFLLLNISTSDSSHGGKPTYRNRGCGPEVKFPKEELSLSHPVSPRRRATLADAPLNPEALGDETMFALKAGASCCVDPQLPPSACGVQHVYLLPGLFSSLGNIAPRYRERLIDKKHFKKQKNHKSRDTGVWVIQVWTRANVN